jgi:hypothetical protein
VVTDWRPPPPSKPPHKKQTRTRINLLTPPRSGDVSLLPRRRLARPGHPLTTQPATVTDEVTNSRSSTTGHGRTAVPYRT